MDIINYKKDNNLVFCTNIADIEIYWRLLTFKEYNIYTKLFDLNTISNGKIEDFIFREIVLNSFAVERMNTYPPGIVPSIVYAALDMSGMRFKTPDDLEEINKAINHTREALSTNVYDQIMMYICSAFPSYNPSILQDLEHHELLKLLVMAEKILGLEEPIIFREEKKKNITDQIFEDSKNAKEFENQIPDAVDIRDYLAKTKQNPSGMNTEQQRQLEMIQRIKSRNRTANTYNR
jgi:hypothetical protein